MKNIKFLSVTRWAAFIDNAAFSQEVKRRIRFINFCIDSVVYLILVLLLLTLLQSFYGKDTLKWLMISFYYFYYLLLELISGQTIGKMITKTKVVSTSGKKAKTFNIVLRTILRMIPFDFVSYLIYEKGIHDHFSNTKLVKL